jgi:hypothetical protein
MKRLYSIIFFGSVVFCSAGLTVISNDNYNTRNVVIIPFNQPDTSVYGQLFKVDSFDLNIIPPSSGVQFYKNGIVFLGLSRDFSKMVPVHVSFGSLQAYYAILGDTVLINPAVFSPAFTFFYPCDAISFSSNYDVMYFTKSGKKGEPEKIYQSNYTTRSRGRGSWTEVTKPMDFCTGNSIYTHPSVSTDGKMMVFASDMAGSAGGIDLFVIRKDGERWSEPENLGKLINTKSNELYPFLDPSNNLYFSSEGQPGFGGYDVFVCRFNGKGWEVPLNLTKVINSPNDDVAFTLNRETGKMGFYSSIQKTKDRLSQLYKITFSKQPATANLSDAFLSMAKGDTTFLQKRMLIAKADETVKATELAKTAATAKAAEAAKTAEAARVAEAAKAAEITKAAEAAKAAERAKAEESSRATELAKAEEAARAAEKARLAKAKADTVISITKVPEKFKDVVVYRVQFLSSPQQRNIEQITADGKSYVPYIYFYKNEYRYTAGEFTALPPAKELQFALRKSGYPQAFVAAFKNNIRTLDLSLFIMVEADRKLIMAKADEQARIAEQARAAEYAKADERTIAEEKARMAEAKPVVAETTAPASEKVKDAVIYRVQILTSSTPKSKSQITVNGENYSTFEYLYSGAYRICVGEFSTLAPAREFQSTLRKSGYAQAFVVAFRNNVRSLDAALFK